LADFLDSSQLCFSCPYLGTRVSDEAGLTFRGFMQLRPQSRQILLGLLYGGPAVPCCMYMCPPGRSGSYLALVTKRCYKDLIDMYLDILTAYSNDTSLTQKFLNDARFKRLRTPESCGPGSHVQESQTRDADEK
jgi:hypothetical protein